MKLSPECRRRVILLLMIIITGVPSLWTTAAAAKRAGKTKTTLRPAELSDSLVKAEKHLDAFIKRAGILVLASHSEGLIRRYCTKAILLEHGKVVQFDGVDDVYKYYNKNRLPN